MERKQGELTRHLGNNGIVLQTGDVMPGPYLVRADSNLKRLNTLDKFVPYPGKDGTRGVFLADNIHSLMYPDVGIYWVFATNSLEGRWVSEPSELYDQWLNHFAVQAGITPDTYSNYVHLQSMIHSTWPVYQSNEGIATWPTELDPQLAVLALLYRHGDWEVFAK